MDRLYDGDNGCDPQPEGCHVCGSDDTVKTCEVCDRPVCHEHASYSATHDVQTCAPISMATFPPRFWCDATEAEKAAAREGE